MRGPSGLSALALRCDHRQRGAAADRRVRHHACAGVRRSFRQLTLPPGNGRDPPRGEPNAALDLRAAPAVAGALRDSAGDRGTDAATGRRQDRRRRVVSSRSSEMPGGRARPRLPGLSPRSDACRSCTFRPANLDRSEDPVAWPRKPPSSFRAAHDSVFRRKGREILYRTGAAGPNRPPRGRSRKAFPDASGSDSPAPSPDSERDCSLIHSGLSPCNAGIRPPKTEPAG